MPSKSKNKGNAFEREVANFLTATYHETFLRVPTSGAFIGGKNNVRKELLGEKQIHARKGDIQPPDTWKKWNAECKSYADFPFHQLFYGDVKKLDEWIAQTYDAADYYDLNIIFMKFSRKGKWVAFEDFAPFQVDRGIKYKDWIFCSWEDFWSKQDNIDKVKELSIDGFED